MKLNEASGLKYPDSIILRIAKSSISQNSKISKSACKVINRSSVLFSMYIASLSSSEKEGKMLVQESHVENVLKTLEFKKSNSSRANYLE